MNSLTSSVAPASVQTRMSNQLLPNNISMNQSTIMDSTEILEIIFSHLEFKDRMSATLVCHRWSGTATPLRQVLLKLAGCWDRSVNETFLASDRRYRHLEVHYIIRDIRYTSKLISKFRDSLETLEVESVYERDWLDALCGLPRLRELCLKCPLVVKSPALHPKRPCRSMRSLTIDEIDGSDFAFLNAFVSETFPGLTALRLTDFVGDLRINGLPNLETLEVVGTGVLDDRLLQNLKALPKLRDIKFTGKMLDFNNHAQSATIDQVQKVELRTNVRIDDEQLLQLTKVFPAIDGLIIGCITNCTAAGVEAAKQRLPKCSFEIYGHRPPVYGVLQAWSDSESTDLDTDTDTVIYERPALKRFKAKS